MSNDMTLYRNFFIFCLCILIIPGQSELRADDNFPALEMKIKKGYFKVEACTGNILHISYSRNPGYVSKIIPSLKQSEKPSAVIQKTKKTATLKTSQLLCELSLKSNTLTIRDTSGRTAFLEAAIPGQLKENRDLDTETFNIAELFKISENEGLYGLAEASDTAMNRHNGKPALYRLSPSPVLPFLLSTKNYGILWANTSGTVFQCSATGMSFSSETADAIDFFIITGKNSSEVMNSYHLLTEPAPFLPLWAYGYWQSVENNKTQKQIFETAAEYRLNRFPVDVFARDLPSAGKHTSVATLYDIIGNPQLGQFRDSLLKIYNIEYLVQKGPEKHDTAHGVNQTLTSNEFTGLKNKINSTVNACINGKPYEDAAMGWYIPSGPGSKYPFGMKDLAYRELYIRWFQFGVFCPVFRSPITGVPQEIYRFGERGSGLYESILQWINFRYLILPYIYSYAREMHVSGYPLMRPLALDFPADKKAKGVSNEYMFGPSILVRPVTAHQYYQPLTETLSEQMMIRPAYDSVNCYLPGGAEWFDLYTGRRFEGGQTVSILSPLEIIPVFIKAGSIIPYNPRVQYAAEKKADTVDLRIYPGSDAVFSLYEGEPNARNDKNGTYSIIPIHWNDKEMTVTIGKRQGEFPGMLKQRTFRIILISPVIQEGFYTATSTEKTMNYSGEQTSVKSIP